MAAVSLMTFGLVGCGSESPQSADAAEQGKNEESVELNGTKYVNVSLKDEDYKVTYDLFEFEI